MSSTLLGLLAATVVLIGAALAVRRASKVDDAGLRVTGLLHVNVNCSDFERSRSFYSRLGFRQIMAVEPAGDGDVAAAVGMDSYRLRGALMAHRDGSVIDLLEWRSPRDSSPNRPALNRLGIARIALTTDDLDGDVESLKEAGVEFLSDRPGEVRDPVGGTTRFICFRDPDGAVLELVQMGAVMGALHRAAHRVAGPRPAVPREDDGGETHGRGRLPAPSRRPPG
jgi:catechol 2,3-dioxygenase-like lactoylglutathione lyase family enzyme